MVPKNSLHVPLVAWFGRWWGDSRVLLFLWQSKSTERWSRDGLSGLLCSSLGLLTAGELSFEKLFMRSGQLWKHIQVFAGSFSWLFTLFPEMFSFSFNDVVSVRKQNLPEVSSWDIYTFHCHVECSRHCWMVWMSFDFKDEVLFEALTGMWSWEPRTVRMLHWAGSVLGGLVGIVGEFQANSLGLLSPVL